MTCVYEVGADVWHAFSAWLDWNDRWVPIVCGQGINLPGNPVERVPTCPRCLELLSAPTREELFTSG